MGVENGFVLGIAGWIFFIGLRPNDMIFINWTAIMPNIMIIWHFIDFIKIDIASRWLAVRSIRRVTTHSHQQWISKHLLLIVINLAPPH